MSKRKKSYDRAEYENNYYNNRLIDSNYVGNNFNPYLNTKFQFNNFNDIYNNLNNIMDVLNNVDINNLNNIFSLLSNGFDIIDIEYKEEWVCVISKINRGEK